jgi:hypothetical protein
MKKIDNMKESRTVSSKVKGLILRNPGLTSNEIFSLLPEERHEDLAAAIRQITNNGMFINRNNKYYALGHSVRARVKRRRQKLIKASQSFLKTGEV